MNKQKQNESFKNNSRLKQLKTSETIDFKGLRGNFVIFQCESCKLLKNLVTVGITYVESCVIV